MNPQLGSIREEMIDRGGSGRRYEEHAHCLEVHWHSMARGFGAIMPSDGLAWLDLGSIRLTSAERLRLIVFFANRAIKLSKRLDWQRWLSEKLDLPYN